MVIDWPETNQDNSGNAVWQEITRHCKSWRSFYFSSDSVTTAHECTHGCNADIRNSHPSSEGRYNAFYLLDNKAILAKEPNFTKDKVARFVPTNLRGSRYSLYVLGMNEWNDSPLYLWDEWSAYQNGALEAATCKQQGNADWAMGPLEFCTYGLALMMACHQYDPSSVSALRDDFFTLFARGWDSAAKAVKVFPWSTYDSYINSFNNCAELNNFLYKLAKGQL